MDSNPEQTRPLSKIRAIRVTLSDGRELIVHSPRTSDLAVFINSLAALDALQKSFTSLQIDSDGIIGLQQVLVDPIVMKNLYPMMASMSDISVEELESLDLWDGMAILTAFKSLIPNSISPTVNSQTN